MARESTAKNALVEQVRLRIFMSVLDLASGTGTLAVFVNKDVASVVDFVTIIKWANTSANYGHCRPTC